MKFCANCGTQLNDNDIFCPECGAKNEESFAPPQPTYAPPAFGSQPAAPAQPQQAFNRTPPPPTPQPTYGAPAAPVPVQTAKKSNTGLIVGIIIGGFVLLLIIATVLIFALGGRRSSSPSYNSAASYTEQAETTTQASAPETTQAPATEAPTAPPAPTSPPAPTTMPIAPPDVAQYENNYGDSGFGSFYTIVMTNGHNLNMRSGPGTNYSLVGKAPNNAEVYVIEYHPDWSLIYYNGTRGWVSSEYLGGVSP